MSDVTMVERVARAIYASRLMQPVGGAWRGNGSLSETFCLEAARAAIEAMREPSEAMIDSGVAFALNVSIGGSYQWTDYITDKHRAMINAALAEVNPK